MPQNYGKNTDTCTRDIDYLLFFHGKKV